MIIPDINLLLYAYDSDSSFHQEALAWWRECFSDTEPVGLPPVVVFDFIRIVSVPSLIDGEGFTIIEGKYSV